MAGSVRTEGRDDASLSSVEVHRPDGNGDFVLVCEHASSAIPASFRDLGLASEHLTSHIAWDPGALGVAHVLSELLDAPLIAAGVSRLVYDCNRPPHAPDAIVAASAGIPVPGNADLAEADRQDRVASVYEPFRAALNACLDARIARGDASILLTVHSFTPVYQGVRRHLDLGIVHDTDRRFADALLTEAGRDGDVVVARNAPYGPKDGVTHTLATHAAPRGLLNAMLEIRSDLIATTDAQRAMASRLSRYARNAQAALCAALATTTATAP